MSSTLVSKLTQQALRLKQLDQEVVKSVVEWRTDDLFDFLNEFNELKKDIRLSMIDASVIKIDNAMAQTVLQRVSLGPPFQTDRVIEAMTGERHSDFEMAGFSDGELWDLGDEHFYSWFSHYEYVRAMFEIGALIIGISIPKEIDRYVSEVRRCYAFQQYHAVYSMCRTILEAAVRHKCQTQGRLKKSQGNLIDCEGRFERNRKVWRKSPS